MGKTRTIILAAVLALCVVGCARFNTTQKDVSYGDNGQPARTITTRASSGTFFAGKANLSAWKASQTDKTQGASVGSLTQESHAETNVTDLIEAIVGAAVKAAK